MAFSLDPRLSRPPFQVSSRPRQVAFFNGLPQTNPFPLAASGAQPFKFHSLLDKPDNLLPLALNTPSNSAEPKPPVPFQPKRLLAATLAYGAGHLLKFVPNSKVYPGGLISADPLQLGKVALGLTAVSQLNQAMGWKPPAVVKALETVAIVHTLMLGFSSKNAGHLLLMPLLVVPSLLAAQAINHKTHHWLEGQPDWSPRNRTLGEWAVKGATLAGMVGLGVTVYPRLFLQNAKLPWLHRMVGQPAHTEMKNLAFKALIEKQGTPESRQFLAHRVSDALPSYLRDIASVNSLVAHHRSTVAALKDNWRIADGLLEGTLPNNPATLEGLTRRKVRYDEDQVLAMARQGQHLPEHQHQPVRALLDQLKPVIDQAGQTTFGEDYTHFESIISIARQHLPILKAVNRDWQYLLINVAGPALHQVGHKPSNLPFFSLFGAEGMAAMTCPNGCCSGSVFCMADIAEGISSLLNGGLGKQPSNDGKPAPPPSSVVVAMREAVQ